MYKIRVYVTLRPSILDPKGKASLGALQNLGYHRIKDVRIGKMIELDIEAGTVSQAREAAEMAARKLLANEVMEDFEIEIMEETS
ncbi:MAG: phosphoribosylformylglycinamidine synthase subunit PurS [Candidatus Cyclonatronum sp.]|uniref:phosphoribosylformylglycinamidine synthase subunit PurS n=1 Tax=Cyclonatronum sp. TaxID=3024185 RepID=UPI0025BA4A19|nr:phosphoribosylformylglycinamidine synthase subunit PurS [Cyclonatronum sp.]MCC5933525.1 phosphoribosylformylglycinamidine synthase subunit PurS [Balneolales bacterium]MCH8486523.1 phosphoribosylformylglycinamidine synthase subunit PurS [Cyclonatronum sp.]